MSDETVPRTEWTPQVVRIADIRKHENADTLGIVDVFGCYPVVVKLGEHLPGDLVGYIPTDSDVDTKRPEFAFLAPRARASGRHRVRAMKLRGTFSQGLLMPMPSGNWKEGDDITDVFGLEKYIPPSEREFARVGMQTMKKVRKSETWAYEKKVWQVVALIALMDALIAYSERATSFAIVIPVLVIAAYSHIKKYRKDNRKPGYPYYDVTSLLRAGKVFEDGEEVVLTEKLHGSQLSCVHTGKMLHLKSRTCWRSMNPAATKDDGWGFSFDQVWSMVAKRHGLEAKLATRPNMVVFGEVYGSSIQKGYLYGCADGEQKLAVFDVMDLNTRKFLDHDEYVKFCTDLDIPMVPMLYRGPYSESLKEMAEGKSTLDRSHPREGWVCRPVKERHDDRIGRCQAKFIGQAYLLAKHGEDEE